jgi:glucosamine-6-phosphate deaminase
MDERMRIERVGLLKVEVHPTRAAMGFAAAAACRRRIQEAVARRGLCRMIFAAAPSQNELLTELRTAEDIPWERIVAFHMDEYQGLMALAPQRFSNFLRKALFDHVPLKGVCLLDTGGLPIADEMQRYISLLNEAPIDLVCLGVGENGHIAFNDPHVADFNDPFLVKEVELDESCRLQQVHDGAFASLEVVPERAITLTVPALTRGESLFCVVPGPRKALAVKTMLTGPIDESCPASVLRRHPDCTLYLDDESASIWLKTLV